MISNDYERFVSAGTLVPVLLILVLLVEWELVGSLNPGMSRVVRSVLTTLLVPLATLVGMLTLLRATSLVT